MPSYCCKHSCYVVAYLYEVVLISCIRLLLVNYLLIVAKIFKSAGRQTTARPGSRQAMARPAGHVASGLAACGPPIPCSSLLSFFNGHISLPHNCKQTGTYSKCITESSRHVFIVQFFISAYLCLHANWSAR